MTNKKHTIFVYGTLTSPRIATMVVGRLPHIGRATLYDYKRSGLNIIPEEGESVSGMLMEVTDEELNKLDTYESYGKVYTRITVTVETFPPTVERVEAIAYQIIE